MRYFRFARALLLLTALTGVAVAQQGSTARIYNTAKQKLMRGEGIIGGTVISSDPSIYCAMASSGFDFLWIEMQHSPLTFDEVARMISACRGAPAVPFIRVPNANPGDIQKAVDIGALGVIIPLVDTVEEIENALSYAKYPPLGRRSLGGPLAWRNRAGFSFFQAQPDTALLRMGVEAALKAAPPAVAPTEGAER